MVAIALPGLGPPAITSLFLTARLVGIDEARVQNGKEGQRAMEDARKM